MAHKASISGHRPSPLTTAGRDRWQTVGFDLGHYCLISLCWLRLIYNSNRKAHTFLLLSKGTVKVWCTAYFCHAWGNSLSTVIVWYSRF